MSRLQQVSTIARARALSKALRERRSRDWLATTYRRHVYGGWRREDGKWIDDPAKILLNIHEACKALYCPACAKCNKPPRNCRCTAHEPCWVYVGQAGKDEADTFRCEKHGDVPFRECLMNWSVFGLAGNQSGKTTGTSSEFSSWILGRRPWDDTLTAPAGSGRIWGYACKSLTNVTAVLIDPELRLRLQHMIEDTHYNSAKTISHYSLRNGDMLKFMSYEQFKNAGAFGVNPFEGPRFFGFAWDEPMPSGARSAVVRGLVRARSAGWGREIGAMTPLRSHYVKNQIQDQAWNTGGEIRGLHVVGGSIHDNPSLTEAAKDSIMAAWGPEEREAREFGFFLHLAGRVYGAFHDESHVYDDSIYDPTVGEAGEPNDNPVMMAVDPHGRRPWAMVWVCLDRQNDWYVIREWPTETFRHMKSSSLDFAGYKAVIAQVESTIPGGSARVLWREMDPNFGRSPATGMGYDTIARAMRDKAIGGLSYAFRTDAADDIEQGHTAVKQLLTWDETRDLSDLNHPRLRVGDSCRNTIWSFHNYVHKEHPDEDKAPREEAKDAGKDHLDCIRYLAMKRYSWASWKERHGVIGEQIRRLVERQMKSE